jgi:anti-sigma regulatory factor (Ser/Thr protein kinase)
MSCTRLEDRAAISAAARSFAHRMGFGQHACWEIEITVQELVSNIVRHAGGGYLELCSNEDCIEIAAVDRGPGIPAVVVAASHDSSRGLGAIHRLMHDVQIESARESGTRIFARRYLDRKR